VNSTRPLIRASPEEHEKLSEVERKLAIDRLSVGATQQVCRKGPMRPAQPLGRAAKMLLAAEIVGVYVPTRARMVCHRLRLAEQLDAAQSPNPSDEFSRGQRTAEAIRLGSAVARTLDLIPIDSSCLTRSVILARLLSRRGIESSLVIGVSDEDSFTAHAWIEHRGMPLLDPGPDALTRLTQLDVLDEHKQDDEPD
jgi:hypothetical protein